MKGARKNGIPHELTVWLDLANEDWTPSYPFNEPSVRDAVVSALKKAQRDLCVYCGRKLDYSDPGNSFHIEHFRPQSSFSELSVSYENLFLSCGQRNISGNPSPTCGSVKENRFDPEYVIEPIYPECTSRFRFHPDGKISTSAFGDTAASYWIDLLKLDHIELEIERRQLLVLLDSGTLSLEDMWDEHNETADTLAHVAYSYEGKTLP